jgi:glycosyltransferase involved in cell wall biosynthesis
MASIHFYRKLENDIVNKILEEDFLFTVVIPTFNSTDLVERTLTSVFNQNIIYDSSCNYEILIIDDKSADIEQLRHIVKKYPKVKLIEKDIKTNAAFSRQIGFESASGEYVFFLDSDDEFLPDHIGFRIDMHKKYKFDFIFGRFAINNERNVANFPAYNDDLEMEDYIFELKGDTRSSTFSVSKLGKCFDVFDRDSFKHQDWITAILMKKNEKKLGFDNHANILIYEDHSNRMSASMNISASEYFVTNYLAKQRNINSFSKRHWKKVISTKDANAFEFFKSVFKYQSLRDLILLFAFIILYRVSNVNSK